MVHVETRAENAESEVPLENDGEVDEDWKRFSEDEASPHARSIKCLVEIGEESCSAWLLAQAFAARPLGASSPGRLWRVSAGMPLHAAGTKNVKPST